MDIESFRELCISRPGVTEEFPFDNNTLVFKVMGKMFALADVDHFVSINLKCDPEEAIRLREHYAGIRPGYHMNKKHWNTIEMDGSVPDAVVRELISESYRLVVNGLTRKMREELEGMK
ncbi:MmcQ/YjbR family DNA-binding protein [Fulvivirga sedimenti]|uniref:MmcQ/YjbR family DNA-binding protein n=1 Tax=Fulvivirga sedimenti TaxID=2879465 RepID=A0A9X1HML8_9BACT|nr:MmcQ/YjbR family DNA-binding protein [Fulvivirga sedimenti]